MGCHSPSSKDTMPHAVSHALPRHRLGLLLTGTCPHCPLRSSNSQLRPKHRRWGFWGKGRHDGLGRTGNAGPLPGESQPRERGTTKLCVRDQEPGSGTQPGAPRIAPGTALDGGPGPLPPGPELSGPTAPGAPPRKASLQPCPAAGPAPRSAAAQLRPGPAPRPRGTPHLRPGAARRGAPAARAAPWPEPRPSDPIRPAPRRPSRPESNRAARGGQPILTPRPVSAQEGAAGAAHPAVTGLTLPPRSPHRQPPPPRDFPGPQSVANSCAGPGRSPQPSRTVCPAELRLDVSVRLPPACFFLGEGGAAADGNLPWEAERGFVLAPTTPSSGRSVRFHFTFKNSRVPLSVPHRLWHLRRVPRNTSD